MKKILSLTILAVAVIASLVLIFQDRLVSRMMETVIQRNFESTILDRLPDGLHVLLCGAGSPLPDPKRSGPCTAVIAGEQVYIIDSGSGASTNLTLFQVPQGKINSILLTHFHSDHIDGLGEVLMQRWVNAANASPTPVYGPKGVEEIVAGFNHAYRQDQTYRVAHHGEKTIIPSGAGGKAFPFDMPKGGELKTIIENGDLKISTFLVDHEPVSPSVGYRFDYQGRSVVISGDTKKSSNLQNLSENVDLLVHEALNREMVGILTTAAHNANRPRMVKITEDILDYHTSPVEAAEIARDANVGHLLLSHIVPPLPVKPMEALFLKGVSDVYSSGVTVGKDGTLVSLPTGSKEIVVLESSSLVP